jgi:hypothetical protein
MRRRILLLGLLSGALVPAAAGGPGKAPPETTITSGPPPIINSASATFTFTSNEDKARFGCALDRGAFFDCRSPITLAVHDGTHQFYAIAIDGDRTDPTPAVRTWSVDTKPPSPVRQRALVSYRRLVLSWGALGTAGADHIVVLRTTRPKKQPSREVYRGSTSSYVERNFANGIYHRYRLVASDRAGNSSAPVDVVVGPNALLLAPKEGARVQAPPTLRWRAVRHATFYNAQLFRGGKKLLSAWPRSPKLKLTRSWTYLGNRSRLKPGRYTWYVWPGFGALAHPRYGGLVGHGTFVVSRSSEEPPARRPRGAQDSRGA